MTIPPPEIELTADGSATLRSTLHGDTYHSLRGAVGEARHVFIEAGFREVCGIKDQPPPPRYARVPLLRKENKVTGSPYSAPSHSCKGGVAAEGRRGGKIAVLEMGFGTGLNAWLTLEEASMSGTAIEYTGVELYPVPVEVAASLNYTSDPRFSALHTTPWGEWCEPSEGFGLRKIHRAMADFLAGSNFSHSFDVVYWDAFAPDTQPGLWTAEIFTAVFEATAPGGVLVTYSSKGDVRRALHSAGFEVERLPGALGKRHMLRARKKYKL